MSDLTNSSDLNEESNQLKEKLVKDENPKRNLWYVDVDLRKKYGLSFIEAAFLCMITQLQCVKEGHCRAKNYYFMDALDISDKWIERALKKLLDLNLIWIHIYNTKNGKRRQIVTAESIRLYQDFLKSHKSWALLKKFQQEFALINLNPEPSNDSPKTPSNESQVTDTIPSDTTAPRPSDKMSIGPPDKMSIAINTTYLPNKKNDVTCKGSDDPPAAVSSSKLKEELEQSYTQDEVEIGMKWYEMQSPSKKQNMKKPIACIVNALNGGYAHEEVASQNAQLAAQLAQEREKKKQKEEVKEEINSNAQLAAYLVKKFSHLSVWKHSIDKKGFSITNEGVEKGEDDANGCRMHYYILPSGEKRYGKNHFIRVDFDLPASQFKKEIKTFFEEASWKNSSQLGRKTA